MAYNPIEEKSQAAKPLCDEAFASDVRDLCDQKGPIGIVDHEDCSTYYNMRYMFGIVGLILSFNWDWETHCKQKKRLQHEKNVRCIYAPRDQDGIFGVLSKYPDMVALYLDLETSYMRDYWYDILSYLKKCNVIHITLSARSGPIDEDMRSVTARVEDIRKKMPRLNLQNVYPYRRKTTMFNMEFTTRPYSDRWRLQMVSKPGAANPFYMWWCDQSTKIYCTEKIATKMRAIKKKDDDKLEEIYQLMGDDNMDTSS